MIALKINGISVQSEEGASILRAALTAGVPVPHICADPRTGNKGKCGLCLVAIEGRDGLVRACETPVEEGTICLC